VLTFVRRAEVLIDDHCPFVLYLFFVAVQMDSREHYFCRSSVRAEMKVKRSISIGRRAHASCSLMALRMVMHLTLLVGTNGAALAGDFVLNYAVDADGKADTGKLADCSYEQICEIRVADLRIEILVCPRTTGFPTLDMTV